MTNKKITKVKRRRDESLQSYINRQRKLDESLQASIEEEKRRKFREESKEPPETALAIIFCGIATVAAVMFVRGDIKFNQNTAAVTNTEPHETVIDDANGTRAKQMAAETVSSMICCNQTSDGENNSS